MQGKSKGKAKAGAGKVTQFEIAQRKAKLAEMEASQEGAKAMVRT
jgi:hypothetical protein